MNNDFRGLNIGILVAFLVGALALMILVVGGFHIERKHKMEAAKVMGKAKPMHTLALETVGNPYDLTNMQDEGYLVLRNGTVYTYRLVK